MCIIMETISGHVESTLIFTNRVQFALKSGIVYVVRTVLHYCFSAAVRRQKTVKYPMERLFQWQIPESSVRERILPPCF